MRWLGGVWLVASLACSTGCETGLPGPAFERMIGQRKARPFAAEPLLPGGTAMQPPPGGTVRYQPPAARQAAIAHPEVRRGVDGAGTDLTEVPVPVTEALLDAGKERFEIFCAACHGLKGDGASEVARHMEQRKPPSLVDARVRSFKAGQIFRVVGEGYGLMPGYARALDPDQRWAVVAYLRALQLSQSVALASLPVELRREAEGALR